MGDRESLRRERTGQEMNITKIKEALSDARKEKRRAEYDNYKHNYAYWQGYEEGLLMAMIHLGSHLEENHK